MVLLRRELGDVLREHRQTRGLTLRGLSALAAVSPGYLSEIERGTKEASSELLASVCAALGVPLSDVLATLSVRIAEVEALTSPVLVPMPAPLAPVSASAA
ncbi:MAG: helix-turn-helix transcriptional regulator [Actinomycetales bacterium]|nr:helix-turn-helix transcriptional regulator [Actinomycetales bacterium]